MKKGKLMAINRKIKRFFKWVGGIILVLILLPILLALLLYFPPIQNWAVKNASSYISKETSMNVSIGHIRLSFPLDLDVEDLLITSENKVKEDTLAQVKDLKVKVKLLPLFKSQVEIDGLTFKDTKFNTLNLIDDVLIKGTFKELSLKSHGIDLDKETIIVDETLLSSGKISIELSDTAQTDTTSSSNKVRWKIKAKNLMIDNTEASLSLPGDTLSFKAFFSKAEILDGYIDLENSLYQVGSFLLTSSTLSYDNNFEPYISGFDYNHIEAQDVNLKADSIFYQDPQLKVNLKECSLKEKSGILVENLSSYVELDSLKIYAPNLQFKTSESSLEANVNMDLNTFSDASPGDLLLTLSCSIGKQDIIRFFSDLPSSFVKDYPSGQLEIKTALKGNLKEVDFSGLNIKLPSSFNLNAKGSLGNLTSLDKLKADVSLQASAYDVGFLSSLINISSLGIKIPKDIGIDGKFSLDGTHLIADLTALESQSSIKGNVDFDYSSFTYDARLDISEFQIDHFLVEPTGLGALTANLNLKGKGTDLLLTSTSINANAGVNKLSFSGYNLDNINFSLNASNGKVIALLESQNKLFKGNLNLNAYVNNKMLKSTLVADFDDLDLYGLKISDNPLNTTFCCHVDVDTDLKSVLKADGAISDLVIYDSSRVFRPEELLFDALTRKDTTHVEISCGDFHARLNAKGGLSYVISKSSTLASDMLANLKEKQINLTALRKNMPNAELYFSTGEDNPLSRFIQTSGLKFKETKIDLKSSTDLGLNGHAHVYGLNTSGMQLDTIRFNIVSDTTKCTYNGQIRNSTSNPQYVFNSLFDGEVLENGLNLNVKLFDSKDSLGLKLGLEALMEDEGLRIRMLPNTPVLAYKKFFVNKDNYIFLGNDRRISADLSLKADDGMGIFISSNDNDIQVLQDLTLRLEKFDLEKLFSTIPYMPDITGVLDGDAHIVLKEDDLTLSSKLSISDMTYDGYTLGNMGANLLYSPKEGDIHDINATLSRNGNQVAEMFGTYTSNKEESVDAKLKMDNFPMSLVNGFIPDRVVYLIGYGGGELGISGSLSSPRFEGDLLLDSCYLKSALYGVNLRLEKEPIYVRQSQVKFTNYKMYDSNDNAVIVNGDFDFLDLGAMRMDLKLSGSNIEAINAKENRISVIYGKAYVDFYASLQGRVDNLKMQGRVDVLASTDMSYILRDSPLTTDNQMDELVKFVNFEDSLATIVEHQSLSGFTMDLTMNISRGARVMCYLNTDKTNYIDLMGGGTLRLQYDEENDITLRGRYTLDNGEMKYSLPIIPLKTFTIQDGSYIEFTGDPMNPTLNITATETTNANVSSSGGGERTVEFKCGVVITKTLADMGLEFTLDAPEDMTLHNELMEMGAEQRGKIAVTMLTTGMYLADGETGAFSMNNALSSFLQSEINNITGNALRSLDLSIGFDSATDAQGNTHTDYSFKFSKRFWNNRLRIVVGGKVSTGAEVQNQNESFFDNVTFEYRLGKSADKYLNVYYDNNAYDWLEGTTKEYGGGFTWRRSLQHFKDIFKFKNTDDILKSVPQDTIVVEQDDDDDFY